MKSLQEILNESLFDDNLGVSVELPFVKDFELNGSWNKYLGGNKVNLKVIGVDNIFKFQKQKQEIKQLGWKLIRNPDRGPEKYDDNLVIYSKYAKPRKQLYIYPNKFNFNWPAGEPDSPKYYQGNPPNRMVLGDDLQLLVQFAPVHPSIIMKGDYNVYSVPDEVIEGIFDMVQIKYSKK